MGEEIHVVHAGRTGPRDNPSAPRWTVSVRVRRDLANVSPLAPRRANQERGVTRPVSSAIIISCAWSWAPTVISRRLTRFWRSLRRTAPAGQSRRSTIRSRPRRAPLACAPIVGRAAQARRAHRHQAVVSSRSTTRRPVRIVECCYLLARLPAVTYPAATLGSSRSTAAAARRLLR